MSLQVCLLGFGEVGQALVGDFGARGLSNLAVWDVLFTVADSAPRRAAVGKPVRVAANVEDAVANADLVISAVTAAQDVAAARSVVPHLKRNAYFFDVNSVSPGVKVEVSQIVEAAGGRYIESAIMSIQLKAASGAICTLSLSFNNDGPLGTFFRYICDNGTYIARYDDLIDGKDQAIDVSKVDVSMNGIELQDREFVAAIRDRREPNASVAQVLPCYRTLHAGCSHLSQAGQLQSRVHRS